MNKKQVIERVEKILENLIMETELELVDVEYVRDRDWVLRIYIDKEGGIDLSDCQNISQELGIQLDKEDFISENYLLEVSSPGVNRVVKSDRDILRYTGRKVDVNLFAPQDGKKSFVAILNGLAEDGSIQLNTENGEELWQRDKIAQMRLHFEF